MTKPHDKSSRKPGAHRALRRTWQRHWGWASSPQAKGRIKPVAVSASAAPPGPDTPKRAARGPATRSIPRRRPASPAAASPRRKRRQRRQPRLGWAALLRLTRAQPPGLPQQGSYLKPAGELSRALRPDGGLALLFSLSAMTPRYSSAIRGSEHEDERELPPRKHLSGLAVLIQWCIYRLAEKQHSPPPIEQESVLINYVRSWKW